MLKQFNILAMVVALSATVMLTACEQKSDLEKDLDKAGSQMEKSANDAMKKIDGALK